MRVATSIERLYTSIMQVTPAQLSSLAQQLLSDEGLATYALECYTTHWDGDPDANEISLTAIDLQVQGLTITAGVRYAARTPGGTWVHRRLYLEDLAAVVGEEAMTFEEQADEDSGEQ
jgi:hypothetical protein